mmetsp:Transcript_121983/g.304398  ORF Transcript_121983/g.304398 Transcript_121983/m.304398 type:complete len:118 (-) Transcript_121983:667-1020(-)
MERPERTEAPPPLGVFFAVRRLSVERADAPPPATEFLPGVALPPVVRRLDRRRIPEDSAMMDDPLGVSKSSRPATSPPAAELLPGVALPPVARRLDRRRTPEDSAMMDDSLGVPKSS